MGVGLFGGQSPEIVGRLDPVTGKMDLHDLTVVSFWWQNSIYKKDPDNVKADTLKSYISWAIDHGFGVIDANVPKFLTGISVSR